MSWGERKMDIIFDGISRGMRADEIQQQVRRELNAITGRKGVRSEHNFVGLATQFFGKDIEYIRASNPIADMGGVDYFIQFKSGEIIPVQVKSCDRAVIRFKQGDKYLNFFKRRIMVINSATYVSRAKFVDHFTRELERVRELTNS